MDAESQSTGKIIPADKDGMALLYSQMESDAEFKKLLTAPIDIHSRYDFLVGSEIAPGLLPDPLLSIIELAVGGPFAVPAPFFYVSGSRLNAFFACFIEDDAIDYIKVFSFRDSPNGVLAEDLVFFVKENRHKYREIRWASLKGNPANDQHLKALKTLTGDDNEPVDDGKYFRYAVKGLKK